jgi:ankyrin repeat protein
MILSNKNVLYKKMSFFNYIHGESCEEMISLLEEQNVNPNEKNKYGMTPLHHVATELFEASCMSVTDDDIYLIKLLLKHGADPNIQDNFGRTPIMCFDPENTRYCNTYMIFDILRNITNLELKDNNGRTFNDKYWEIKIEE